jgi:undecaprenyl-diphosphatase
VTDPARRVHFMRVAVVVAGLAVFLALAFTVKDHPGAGSFDARVERWATDAPRTIHDIAAVVTWLGSWLTLLPIALAVAIVERTLRRTPWPLALLPLVALGGAIVLYNVGKALTNRPRPPASLLTSSAFPSGHATAAVAVWGTIAIVVGLGRSRRAKVLLLIAAKLIALAVGVSRVILGVHWPTDVIAGWALGAALLAALSLAIPRYGTDRITSTMP